MPSETDPSLAVRCLPSLCFNCHPLLLERFCGEVLNLRLWSSAWRTVVMSVVQLCDGGQSPSRVKASMLFRLHYVDFVCAEHQQPAPKIEPICSSVRSTSAKARDKRTCSCETQQQRSSAMAQSPPRKTICQCFQACAISICDNLQGGCLREWQNLSRCLTVSLFLYQAAGQVCVCSTFIRYGSS